MTTALLERLRFHNPVLSKDLRTRMRGTKAFIIQGVYLLVLVLMMGIAYFGWYAAHRQGASPLVISSDIGRLFYALVFETQAALVVLIAPALTAASITMEREQRTYDLLACTRLRPRTILVGKLLSAWLFVLMLLTCSLPLASLCLMFGGVSVTEIGNSYLLLCLFALLAASVGLWCSTVLARSVTAIVVAYGLTAAFIIATYAMDPTQTALGRALNPFGFLARSADPLPLFGLPLPSWLSAAVAYSLASLLAVNWAMARLPHFGVSRALALRGLTALLLVALVALAQGAPRAAWSVVSDFGIAVTLSVGLVLLAPVFATGDGANPRPRSLLLWLLGGLHPRRFLAGDFSSAWVYLLALVLLAVGALRLGAALPYPATVPHPYLPSSGAAAAAKSAFTSPVAMRLFIVLAAVLACYSALGAVGAALRSRRAGVALMLLLAVLTYVVPGILWMRAAGAAPVGHPTVPEPSLYLAPYAAVLAIVDPGGAARRLPAGMVATGAHPFWAETAVIYGVLAALFLVVAEVAHRLQPLPAAAPVRQEG